MEKINKKKYVAGALQGKVIWVVGASSGIGEHLSLWLARGGAKLVLSSRRRDELDRVKQACHGIMISSSTYTFLTLISFWKLQIQHCRIKTF